MQRHRICDPLTESNCYLLQEGTECIVIDPNRTEVVQQVEQMGVQPRYILLTHEHCDHMAGLEAMRERWPQAWVVCTEACSTGLQSTRLNMTSMMEVYLTFQGKPGVSYPPFVCRPVDETFSQLYTIRWKGHQLRCIPLPGHTPGSMGIWMDEGCFFSGDYLIPEQPVILRLPGGSQDAYEQHTKPILIGLPVGVEICPGHGEPYVRQRKEG